MAIFAISDLHLPARQKPMDIFGDHWANHFDRISQDWRERVSESDVVLLPGDLTWAMHLEEALEHSTQRWEKTFSAAISDYRNHHDLADRLVIYNRPSTIEFTDEPLRDDAGNVRRSQLREDRLKARG